LATLSLKKAWLSALAPPPHAGTQFERNVSEKKFSLKQNVNMKKLIVILFAAGMLAACGDSANRTSGTNTDENVEENSGEILSPETNEADSMNVDTLSYPAPADSL
jgi:hypothetical protein